MKFALAKSIFKGRFLIFDDAFINYDDKRLLRTLYFLLDQSTEGQILYFSCQSREVEMFRSENIKVNIIKMEDR